MLIPPLFMVWREIDYKKVREEISKVINHLDQGGGLPDYVIELGGYRQTKQNKD